jgi:hypothetical protein
VVFHVPGNDVDCLTCGQVERGIARMSVSS